MAMFQRWSAYGVSTFNGVANQDGTKVTAGPISRFLLGRTEFDYNGTKKLQAGERVRFSLESIAGSGTTLVLR
ncbi:MAG: hypothetical protein GC136_01870 [Alphaproteobacteria bacterium]|nr:hypothetical protein [Alphaproteobacteria bacterium]